ncbi:hypothetical protein [Streptomyces glaucosporus]|uniref:hypothetical protein n=1 Tax=Streptomyces glaucosporus TaxID=284044 RepID=UPI0031CEAA90
MTNDLQLSARTIRLAGPVRHRPPWTAALPGAPVPARTVRRGGRAAPGAEGETARSYRAEVVAEGPVNGTTVAVPLGRHSAPNRRLALRWLREQARRVADGLDPDPAAPWIPDGTLARVPERLPDAPAELRRWCEDDARQRAASELLAEGLPFHFAVADHTGSYALRAWPVGVTTPALGTSPLAYARRTDQLPPRSPEPRLRPAARRTGSATHPW